MFICWFVGCLLVVVLLTHSSFVSGGSSFGTLVKPKFLQSTVPENYLDDGDDNDDGDGDDDDDDDDGDYGDGDITTMMMIFPGHLLMGESGKLYTFKSLA